MNVPADLDIAMRMWALSARLTTAVDMARGESLTLGPAVALGHLLVQLEFFAGELSAVEVEL